MPARKKVKMCDWCEDRPADTVAWDWDICWACFRGMHEPTPAAKLMRVKQDQEGEGHGS